MTVETAGRRPVPTRSWLALGLVVVAGAVSSLLVSAPSFLIPTLLSTGGVSLPIAGLLAAAPTIGQVLTLIAWGGAVDRWGSRAVITTGLALAGAACVAAALVAARSALSPTLFGIALLCIGGSSAATNSASGPLLVGSFPRRRRGLAMGIRQMSLPLGIALGAVIVPVLARSGIEVVYIVLGCAAAGGSLAAVLLLSSEHHARRPSTVSGAASSNPYRGDRFLVRVHLTAVLLIVPQYTLSIFGLTWMITGLHVAPATAGAVVAAAQLLGAGGRLGTGAWSDSVGSRVRTLRFIAIAGVGALLLLAAAAAVDWPVVAVPAFVVASAVSVADNGVTFTSVAEVAGEGWAGRTLAVHNTGQYLVASAIGPVMGGVIAVLGFPVTFALAALGPVVAIRAVPRVDRR